MGIILITLILQYVLNTNVAKSSKLSIYQKKMYQKIGHVNHIHIGLPTLIITPFRKYITILSMILFFKQKKVTQLND